MLEIKKCVIYKVESFFVIKRSELLIHMMTWMNQKFAEKTSQTQKVPIMENQDGGVGRHTAPPRTTRTDRELNGKGVRHQGNKK